MMQDFNHKHILVRAEVRNPPKTIEAMNAWLVDTVAAVDMKVLMGPYSIRCDTEGNIGITGAVVIETSHMTAHCWEEAETPFIQMDLYSCKDFDPATFVDQINKHFDVIHTDMMVVDRNCQDGETMLVLDNECECECESEVEPGKAFEEKSEKRITNLAARLTMIVAALFLIFGNPGALTTSGILLVLFVSNMIAIATAKAR